MHWHPAPCAPWYAWGGYGAQGWHGYAGGPCHHVPVPMWWPVAPSPTHWPLTVPQEVAADAANSPQEGFVGGQSDAHLTLEYLVAAGATSPTVTVTIEVGGSVSTWTDTGIAEGYHTKEDFAALPPGAKLTLEVSEAVARLRWCETVCC